MVYSLISVSSAAAKSFPTVPRRLLGLGRKDRKLLFRTGLVAKADSAKGSGGARVVTWSLGVGLARTGTWAGGGATESSNWRDTLAKGASEVEGAGMKVPQGFGGAWPPTGS